MLYNLYDPEAEAIEGQSFGGPGLQGVYVDSLGRAQGDRLTESGHVRRGELSEDQALDRMAGSVNDENEALIAQANAQAESLLAEQMQAGELPSLGDDPSMTGLGADINAKRAAGAQADIAAFDEQLGAKERYKVADPFARVARENAQLMFGAGEFQYQPWDESLVDQSKLVPFDPTFDPEVEFAKFTPPTRNEGESVEEWQGRAARAADTHRLVVKGKAEMNTIALNHNTLEVERSKAMHETAQEEERLRLEQNPDAFTEVGSVPGAPGTQKFEQGQQRTIANTQVGQAEVLAAGLERTAKITREGHEKIAGAIEASSQHEKDVQRRSSELLASREAAQARLEEMPRPDAQRYFKNMSGGQKFWAIVGAIAGGFANNSKSVDVLMQLAARDYDEQLADIDQAESQVGALDQEIDSARALFREHRQAVNSDIAHRHEHIAMQLEDAALTLEAEMSRTAIPAVRAQQELLLVEIRKAQQSERHQAELFLQAHPRDVIAKERYALRGDERKRTEKDRERAAGELYESRKEAVAQAEGLEVREAGSVEKARDRQATVAASQGGEQYKEGTPERMADKVASEMWKHIAVTNQMDKFIKKHEGKNIAGRGASAYWMTEPGRATRNELERIVVDLIFANSGAQAPPAEVVREQERIVAGWGDDELLQNVFAEQERSSGKVKARWTGLPDSARETMIGNMRREGLDPAVYGMQSESSQDVAKRLGGTLLTAPR